jgi:5-phospho-D-xylono-1,4-lactonase
VINRLNAAGDVPRPVCTVLGGISHEELGITDAHSHVWIDPVPGGDPQAPVMNHTSEIRKELQLYRAAGGATMLDCQPQGCGRNANQLVSLSEETGVHMLACTGFHRKKYYPPAHPLFYKTAEQAADFFIEELSVSLIETRNQRQAGASGLYQNRAGKKLG